MWYAIDNWRHGFQNKESRDSLEVAQVIVQNVTMILLRRIAWGNTHLRGGGRHGALQGNRKVIETREPRIDGITNVVCMLVLRYMCVVWYAHVCTYTWRMRSSIAFLPTPLPSLPQIPGFHPKLAWLAWNSLCIPGWPWAQRSACFSIPRSQNKGMHLDNWIHLVF